MLGRYMMLCAGAMDATGEIHGGKCDDTGRGDRCDRGNT